MKTYVGCDLSAMACVVHNTCTARRTRIEGQTSGYYNFTDNKIVEDHHQPSVSLWHPTLGFVYLVAYQSHKSQETNLFLTKHTLSKNALHVSASSPVFLDWSLALQCLLARTRCWWTAPSCSGETVAGVLDLRDQGSWVQSWSAS